MLTEIIIRPQVCISIWTTIILTGQYGCAQGAVLSCGRLQQGRAHLPTLPFLYMESIDAVYCSISYFGDVLLLFSSSFLLQKHGGS